MFFCEVKVNILWLVLFNVCIKINKVIKMYYCIGDYRFVYIKMKMDLIYLNVIFKYNVWKRFLKKIYVYFLENYFELVLKM